jgi:hypothetical protein
VYCADRRDARGQMALFTASQCVRRTGPELACLACSFAIASFWIAVHGARLHWRRPMKGREQ